MRVNTFAKAKITLKTKTLAAIGYVTLSSVATACGVDAESNEAADNKEELAVTDVIGRTMTFDKQPERVVFGEGHAIFVTVTLDQENPGDHVVVMGNDLRSGTLSFETKLFEMNPELKDLSTTGNIVKGDVTVENFISHDPDMIAMILDHKKAVEEFSFLTKLNQTGLKYVFTDLRQRPLENTAKSVELFGQIVDEQDNAKKFTDFYTKRANEIVERAAELEDKPKTFAWRIAGLKDCCSTVNKSNLGDSVTTAGGGNLGDSLLDTESGDVAAEKALSVQPEKTIVTGGSRVPDPKKLEILPHVEFGYTAIPETTQCILEGLLKTPGFDTLIAPKKGDLYAIFRQFYDPPYNVFALEQFAKWIHPEEFADLNPVADFVKFHKDYLPSKLSGTFFIVSEPTK